MPMETSDDVAQLIGASPEWGNITTAQGVTVEFVTLTFSCLYQGKAQQLPPLTMSLDQAQTVAMQLLSLAEKAEARGPTATKQ